MLDLNPAQIRLGLSAQDKEDAIRQAAAILSDTGHVDAAYADSMLAREQQTATYLGQGIAIPHGLRNDGHLIHQTAIAVAQFRQGIAWDDEGVVYLVIAIAAKSDEHIQLLANLTRVLQDTAIAEQLAQTSNPQDIIRVLTADVADNGTDAMPDETVDAAYPERVEVLVTGSSGLHARPATEFALLAKKYKSDIRVRHGSKVANAKSMASLLTLGVETGARIRIMAKGTDATVAVPALQMAVIEGLGEEEETNGDDTLHIQRVTPVEFSGDVREGIAAAPGIAWGPAFRVTQTKVAVSDESRGEDIETKALHEALDTAREQLHVLHEKVSARTGSRKAAIFLAHRELLEDPELQDEALAKIHKGSTAARAWFDVTDLRAQEMQALGDPLLAERAVDMRDIGQRVLRILDTGADTPIAPEFPDKPVVVIATDLTPSDTANLDPDHVRALATSAGGPNSHTAILARSLNLPAVVGLGTALDDIAEGTHLIVDGDGGAVVVDPSVADTDKAVKAFEEREALQQEAHRNAYRPAHTTDGRRVFVGTNIGRAEETIKAVEAGAEGVGLLRTEFLFLDRQQPPDEEEQFQALLTMVRALKGLPLIVRTLDIGGDKDVPYLKLPVEDNPFLGVRGIRLCLNRPDLFEPQLRAIVRVAKETAPGAVKIMFPMVASLEEVKEAQELLTRITLELDGPAIPCGIMIEVPSAVVMADVLAKHVDFFSIGTNDLTQYALAMDRLHPTLTRKADGLHPAVLRMIKQVVDAAHAHACEVGVCGNMAAEPAAAPILIGLGVDELSVSPPAVAELKAQVRGFSMQQASDLAEKALACATADEVRAL